MESLREIEQHKNAQAAAKTIENILQGATDGGYESSSESEKKGNFKL